MSVALTLSWEEMSPESSFDDSDTFFVWYLNATLGEGVPYAVASFARYRTDPGEGWTFVRHYPVVGSSEGEHLKEGPLGVLMALALLEYREFLDAVCGGRWGGEFPASPLPEEPRPGWYAPAAPSPTPTRGTYRVEDDEDDR